VLLQIHGGAWVMGNKQEQALPLIHHLAARGWVVVTPNYRPSPRSLPSRAAPPVATWPR